MGSGVALLDADGDGDLDLFLVNGGRLPCCPADPETAPVHRFFENAGGGALRDETARSGLGVASYGMGVAVGDVEGDGDPDLYLANFGANRLFRNRGDGVFDDATAAAGVGDAGWGSSAAFADLDGDGQLDLFVCNYLDFTLETHRECRAANGVPVYCDPDAYGRVPSVLYRNRGDGTFEDGTAAARLGLPGKALGVLAGDLDLDGDPDLYVANDGIENFLFLNDGRGRFSEEGLLAGVALGETALGEAGMGVAAGDVDGDGLPEVFVTNLSGERNALYRNRGGATFEYASHAAGLGHPSLLDTGFGAELVDLDLDGDLDLLLANGHVLDNAEAVSDVFRSRQRHRAFRNEGGRFREIEDFPSVEGFGRGLAVGDLDGDGRPDGVVTHCGGTPYLYRNGTEGRAAWLRLRGARSPRDPVGARVEATVGGRRIVREIFGGGSYLSHSDRAIAIGLGGEDRAESVTVRWPSGRVQAIGSVRAGVRSVLEGSESTRDGR